eukprot:TRINITY_DN4310_c0_g1_i1.p1 TRINITY_DN4310_c0_g1~~TRINITY_DN4310_c0_g1_i1.p1  ORF type:complete len:153 (+),score=22.06 TRINITY_DN4310_c0_g1_i1:284-742(+)
MFYYLVGKWWIFALIRNAVTDMLQAALIVQSNAIYSFRPDVIVGSSWGGAVAVAALCSRVWSGPTWLIAPAQDKVAQYLQVPPPSLPKDVRVIVSHGLLDKVIPLAHSQRLCQNACRAELLVSPKEGHQMNGNFEESALKIIHDLTRDRKLE